jgi:hypothetical protein
VEKIIKFTQEDQHGGVKKEKKKLLPTFCKENGLI